MTSEQQPLVGIIMGSLSDFKIIKPGLDLLEKWDVPYEVLVASAHRTPDRAMAWASGAAERGMRAIIAAAGGAAHLPGVVAAHTLLPVIGLPIESGSLRGVDSLYSIVQMPPGIPVATVGINSAVNAAALALHMLAVTDEKYCKTLQAYREQMVEKVDRQNAELKEDRPGAVWTLPASILGSEAGTVEEAGPAPVRSKRKGPKKKPPAPREPEPEDMGEDDADVRPIDLTRPLRPPSRAAGRPPVMARPSPTAPTPSSAPLLHVGRVMVNDEIPSVEIIEQAVDCLLGGGIVALPTDTVYGLAVDASNEAAVERLYAIKARNRAKPIPVFVDSQRLLASLVRNLSVEVRRMLEAFWPGPLTVIFESRGEEFTHLSPTATLGVRLPDHSIPIALMQELSRPIACTSANPSGRAPATSGREVEQYFGDKVDMILDAGPATAQRASTLIDVTGAPFRLLREGVIERDQICAVIGDLLSPE